MSDGGSNDSSGGSSVDFNLPPVARSARMEIGRWLYQNMPRSSLPPEVEAFLKPAVVVKAKRLKVKE